MQEQHKKIWNSHINDLYRLGLNEGCTKEMNDRVRQIIEELKTIVNQIDEREIKYNL